MSKTYTHTCIWCKKRYDHCDKCKQINSWKAICCSPICFQYYMASQEVQAQDKVVTTTETSEKVTVKNNAKNKTTEVVDVTKTDKSKE